MDVYEERCKEAENQTLQKIAELTERGEVVSEAFGEFFLRDVRWRKLRLQVNTHKIRWVWWGNFSILRYGGFFNSPTVLVQLRQQAEIYLSWSPLTFLVSKQVDLSIQCRKDCAKATKAHGKCVLQKKELEEQITLLTEANRSWLQTVPKSEPVEDKTVTRLKKEVEDLMRELEE